MRSLRQLLEMWTDPRMKETIRSLWRENKPVKDERVKFDASDTSAGYLSEKVMAGTNIVLEEGTGENENKLKISVDDNNVKVAFDFITSDELFFIYKCPQAMVFTAQEYENSPATITPALNTNLAQYDTVEIDVTEVGMIVLTGHTL